MEYTQTTENFKGNSHRYIVNKTNVQGGKSYILKRKRIKKLTVLMVIIAFMSFIAMLESIKSGNSDLTIFFLVITLFGLIKRMLGEPKYYTIYSTANHNTKKDEILEDLWIRHNHNGLHAYIPNKENKLLESFENRS